MSADFNHTLSYERPFKFPRHLEEPLGIDKILAMSTINIHSAIFKFKQHVNGYGNGNGHENENEHGNGNGNWQYSDMDMDIDADKDLEFGNFC